MSFSNPTQIRLGMSGSFFNRNYRVIGRSVLGIIEYGRRYYWNEYYLESGGGDAATLVFEETDGGCEWRLFTMFDPQPPLTAAEAEAKKPGETVELDGGFFHITRVDRSQVYYVEGKAPQGVVPGRVAQYFNAGAGARQIVVSWTGDEVEFYSGMNTFPPLVASAFNLQGFAARRFIASRGRRWFSAQFVLPAILIFALIAIPLGCFVDLSRSRSRPPVVYTKAPKAALTLGGSGVLNGVAYKIIGHELVDVAEVGRRWRRQQYDLQDTDHQNASLLCETGPSGPVWRLCARMQPDNAMTPQEAGAKRSGQTVEVNDSAVPVRELFRSTIYWSESSGHVGDVFYGLSGPLNSNETLFVRWNQTNILYERAVPIPDKTVLAAFNSNGRPR